MSQPGVTNSCTTCSKLDAFADSTHKFDDVRTHAQQILCRHFTANMCSSGLHECLGQVSRLTDRSLSFLPPVLFFRSSITSSSYLRAVIQPPSTNFCMSKIPSFNMASTYKVHTYIMSCNLISLTHLLLTYSTFTKTRLQSSNLPAS